MPVYRKLTGDASSSRTADESAVDERMKETLLHEDLDIMIDLQEANEGRTGKYVGINLLKNALQYLIGTVVRYASWLRPCQLEI